MGRDRDHDIAFLHTSATHVPTFDRLVEELCPDFRVRHDVEEDLLAEAQRSGARRPVLVARVQAAMRNAAASGARVVVCTCSTIGDAAERTETEGSFIASRIDRPMAERAVMLGPRVLVAAALESALAPTCALIEDTAVGRGASVAVRRLVVAGAWARFLDGDGDAYCRRIAEAVAAAAKDVDVVVLAQASMAPAAALVPGWGGEVLASPRLGVRWAADRVKGGGRAGPGYTKI